MNSDLRRLVHDRLISEGLISKNWSGLVLAACDGRDALDGVLQNVKTTAKADEKATATTHAGAYLTSLAVEGWGGAPASPSSSGATGRGSPASPKGRGGSRRPRRLRPSWIWKAAGRPRSDARGTRRPASRRRRRGGELGSMLDEGPSKLYGPKRGGLVDTQSQRR